MMKQHYLPKCFWILLGMLLVLFLAANQASAETQFIRLGSGGPGGSWFQMAGGLSNLFNKKIENVNVSVVSAGGSVALMRLIRKGELEATFTHTLTAYDSWNGVGKFEKEGAWKGIRMMSGMYESVHHFVVRADSGIKSMSDLVGKRVNVGSPGSGSAANSTIILKALGLYDKVKINNLSFGDAGRAMADGQMDALGMSGAPMAAVVTLEASHKIRVLGLSDEEFKKIFAQSPFYYETTLPAGVYKTWNHPTDCIAFQVFWISRDNFDPEAVYKMLKVAYDPGNKDYLISVHRQFAGMSPAFKPMKGLGIPLHSGAVKYWKEKGMDIPAELIPAEMK
ncbi:MAG: TAXI family TRAP transporter solute-binding subunit [Deltaproteobacteria bacterium]|jgi:TRAP transporter TAXI family solute receptor